VFVFDLGRQWYARPLRSRIALALRSMGWSQKKIAEVLGVSQAAVSKLLQDATSIMRLKHLGIHELEAELLVSYILELIEKNELGRAVEVANRYWLLVAASGDLCSVHINSGWSHRYCTACMRSVYPSLSPERAMALADVERAVMLLEASRNAVLLIPEVLSNVVRAVSGAVGPQDVVAVPGRLAKIGGKVRARDSPAFGASKHLAEVVLASGYNACINIKFDELVAKALKSLHVKYVEFSSEHYGGVNPAAEAVSELRERGALARVVVDRGGLGIEPVTYIFGERAKEVVLVVEKIARLYAEYRASQGTTL